MEALSILKAPQVFESVYRRIKNMFCFKIVIVIIPELGLTT